MSSPSAAPKNLGRAVAKGAVWILAVRLTRRSISIVSTLILARLLTPTDFGVYALVMSVYALIELITAFGFGLALIQKQDATDEHYDTAWTLGILFSLLCMVLLWLVAPVAAEMLNEPRLVMALYFVSILFLIDSVTNIGTINFQKHMNFDKYFNLQVAVKVVAFLVTIPMALLLRSYWAMLCGLMAASAARVVLSYIMSPYRPRWRLSRWRELMAFSAWMQLNNLIDYLNRHAANFLVSRTINVAGVGMLSMAKDLGQIISDVVRPINQAAYPAYARVNHDMLQVRGIFYDVTANLTIMAMAMGVGISSIAHLMVPSLLGAQWLEVVPLVQWFALASVVELLAYTSNRLMIAVGMPQRATIIIAVRLVSYLSLLLLLLPHFGVVGVAYAALLTALVVLMVSLQILKRVIHLELMHFLYMLYKPALAALVMAGVIKILFPEHWSEATVPLQLVQLFAAVVAGAVSYVATVLALWLLESRPRGPELHFLKLVWEKTGQFGFLLPASERQVP